MLARTQMHEASARHVGHILTYAFLAAPQSLRGCLGVQRLHMAVARAPRQRRCHQYYNLARKGILHSACDPRSACVHKLVKTWHGGTAGEREKN